MVHHLKALGRESLPERIEAGGQCFSRRTVFKNDFFATTALYEGEHGKVVLKVQRQSPFFFLPLKWVGRLLTAKELAALRRLDGLQGIPRVIGRWGATGLIREFIEGCTLRDAGRVPDDYHDRLRGLIDAVHERGMAYVDLEKKENVLVGDDGRPYLIDFQIAWHWPRRWGGELAPIRLVRRWFQAGDRYHLMKLRRRTRPDQMTPEELAATYRRPWFVRLHNLIAQPLRRTRRRVLDRLEPDRPRGERGRIVEKKVLGVAKECL